MEGCGTGGGRSAPLLRCSRCARRCEKCPGRAARGGTEPGLSGTGAPESRAHQGAPADPEGRRRRAAPRPGARQPPGRLWRAEDGAPARESGAILFAWLPGYGEAFVVPSLESLQLCNLLGFTRRCVQNESPFRSIVVASFPETVLVGGFGQRLCFCGV